MIYGPPASGKLTVAKELSKITNYKIFHNHQTVDLITSLISSDNKNFWNYVNGLRYNLLSILVKEKVNLILTIVFDSRHPENFKKIRDIVQKQKGKIYFVHLIPNKQTLLKRVKGESRKKHGKLKSVKRMKADFKVFDTYGKFNHKNHLQIDNSNLSAKIVAKQINNHFKLK